jgi:outer membrane protein
MNIYKKLFCASVLLAGVATTSLFAQQITRFGVVDMSRVYASASRNTSNMQNYEAKREEFQAEIDRQTEELKQLQSRKAEYERLGNASLARQTDDQIRRKVDSLTNYSNSKNRELDNLRGKLEGGDPFYGQLYAILGKVAESEGFSMILSLQQANGILWYSPTVDVTDKVIAELRR